MLGAYATAFVGRAAPFFGDVARLQHPGRGHHIMRRRTMAHRHGRLTRRAFLAASAATAAALSCREAAAQVSTAAPNADDIDRLFQDAWNTIIPNFPEQASSLGVDTERYGYAELRSLLNERSPEARARFVGEAKLLFDRCGRIDPARLEGLKKPALLSLRYWLEAKVKSSKFPTWDDASGQISPYPVSQLTGAYQQIPDLLDNHHPIDERKDVEAYIDRVRAFARAINQDTDRLRAAAGRGVVAPDFALDKAVDQLLAFRVVQADEQTSLAATLGRRAQEAQIRGEWAPRAQRVLARDVIPAIDRQLAALGEVRAQATHEAGVWRLPDGPAFYSEALRQNLTTQDSPDDIHKLGLELQQELTADIDRSLRKVGLTNGTVGERLRHLQEKQDLGYAKTDEGKKSLLKDTTQLIATMQARLSEVFDPLPQAKVAVKWVPEYREEGAPGGAYDGGPIDGSLPGTYYLNFRVAPSRWGLPTLTFHESVPGHHLQITLENESEALPLVQKALVTVGGFNAYVEGWALYAEQLADQMGGYQTDPLGRIGYQQAALFRAVRLVVDTGLHHKRWTREQALRHYMDALGYPERPAANEVERYCIWPGQACSYMTGKKRLLRLREQATTALGAKFDIKKFHNTVLRAGAMPLEVLDGEIANYIANPG
jgi:uncharacterized protein (DUF885 family)